MAFDLEALSSSTYTTTYGDSDTAVNPDSELDKDAFLQLLLTQLQNQDPTDPMDSSTILTQTSQLAALEAAENTNDALDDLTAQLESSSDLTALSAVGKMASLGSYAITLEDGSAQFEVYFEEEIASGTLNITDEDGNVVRSVSLADNAGESGVIAFAWDGTDDDGVLLEDGYYGVKAEYTDANGEDQESQFGIYPVESVLFDSGTTYLKLGTSYVPMDYIAEFF
jgi:flagellar basal-body rod modification protein FlgD